MSVKIHPIILGYNHAYIIQDKGTVMIDGGAPKELKEFTKAIDEISIKPEDIKLMIMTHGHWDHIGSAKEIKELTGAKIAMHEKEKEWLEKGLKPLPPGITTWGSILRGMMSIFMVPFIKIPPTEVDLVLGDEELSLEEYGIPGKVIYTPGHSAGSVSILLETGDVFVGDMAMNQFPMRIGPGMPVFAEDEDRLKENWKLLLDEGVKTIYPGHGEPFSVDIIKEALT